MWLPKLQVLVRFLIVLLGLFIFAPSTRAADVSAHDVTQTLFRATAATPADYAGKDLSFLDLAGLDFKQANLAGTNLYGSDLTRARLVGSNLSNARLDRSSLSRADLSGANLKGATLLTVTAHLTTEPQAVDAPLFVGADLTDAHIAARLDGANFSNANLTRARLGRLVPTWGTYRSRAVINSSNFSGAILVGADLSTAMLRFSEFRDANLTDANLAGCDFTKTNFSGANFSGADVSGADFDGANLTGVIGLDRAKGLADAKNLDRAIR